MQFVDLQGSPLAAGLACVGDPLFGAGHTATLARAVSSTGGGRSVLLILALNANRAAPISMLSHQSLDAVGDLGMRRA